MIHNFNGLDKTIKIITENWMTQIIAVIKCDTLNEICLLYYHVIVVNIGIQIKLLAFSGNIHFANEVLQPIVFFIIIIWAISHITVNIIFFNKQLCINNDLLSL